MVFSALGVREGLIYSRLSARERKQDALIAAARDLNQLRSRSPRHGEDLIAWTDQFMASSGIDETAEERRLRHAACLLADIGWRAHPDYRGEQSLNIIAHAGFLGIDHPGRAYLALAVFFRHVGVTHDEELSPRIRELASTRTLDRARVLGAAMRVAYMVSASQPGVLPRSPLKVERHRLVLRLDGKFAPLAGDRVATRLRHLGPSGRPRTDGGDGKGAVMASIVIADDTKFYDGTYLETQPLGGTESAVISFARAMARRGHDVTAYTNCAAPIEHEGVRWMPLGHPAPETCDLYIACQHPRLFGLVPRPKRRVVWVLWQPNEFKHYKRLPSMWWYRPTPVFTSQHQVNIYSPVLPRLDNPDRAAQRLAGRHPRPAAAAVTAAAGGDFRVQSAAQSQ